MYKLWNRIALGAVALLAVGVLFTTIGGRTSVGGGGVVESAASCPVTFKGEGSTTVFPIAAGAEAGFESQWAPSTDALLASTGSGAGIIALTAGSVDMAHSSRPLSTNEANGKYVFKIALDEFVIAVKNDPAMNFLFDGVAPDGITTAQLVQIYSAGAGITSLKWSDLSGAGGNWPARLIQPRARATVSGSQPDFISQLGISASTEAATVNALGLPRLFESIDMAQAAAGNVDHIAYTSLANVNEPGLKALTLNGIVAEPETVLNGTYPMKRQLFAAVRDNVQNPRIDNSNFVRADDWVNYLRSSAGSAVIAAQGFVPIPSGIAIPDWDITLDGNTSLADLGGVAGKWGQSSACKGAIRGDANNNGSVSLTDIGVVTNKWGQPGFVCLGNPCNP